MFLYTLTVPLNYKYFVHFVALTYNLRSFPSNPDGNLISVKLRYTSRTAPLDGKGVGTDILRIKGYIVRSKRNSSVLGSGRFGDMSLRHCFNTRINTFIKYGQTNECFMNFTFYKAPHES